MDKLAILFGLLLGVLFARWLWSGRWLREDPLPPASHLPAASWSIESDGERLETRQPEGEDFVRYRSILRTTDLSRLLILQLQLDKAGIRHYRSQNNILHGGEVQLFVETDRLQEAEAVLLELDR